MKFLPILAALMASSTVYATEFEFCAVYKTDGGTVTCFQSMDMCQHYTSGSSAQFLICVPVPKQNAWSDNN